MPEKTGQVFSPKDLIEIHFRQLRHESIEIILDACYNGLQLVLSPTASFRLNDRFKTPRRNQHSFFHDVQLEWLGFEERNGAHFCFSFACPEQLRGAGLRLTNVFEEGKMCALLAFDDETNEVNVILFQCLYRTPRVRSGEPDIIT